MKLVSVNVSAPKEIEYKGEIVTTGIFKTPAQGRMKLTRLNLEGDGQADLKVHGGIHKAVYAYPFEHYDYWKRKLGRNDFVFGQFGENFTVEGMLEDQIHIGDVLSVGTAVVQVTQPRVPCYKLGIRMNLPTFPKLFMAAAFTGFYLRVLEEGEVCAGDPIERLSVDPGRMSVQQIFRLAYHSVDDEKSLLKALTLEALSPGWHEMFEERLQAT